jgi:putative transposase
VGERTKAVASATSKSAVSRRFVAASEIALAELLAADLSQLDLVAFMVIWLDGWPGGPSMVR